jgi:hypothetical protein
MISTPRTAPATRSSPTSQAVFFFMNSLRDISVIQSVSSTRGLAFKQKSSILLEQRQREVLEVDQRDLGPGISGSLGSDGHEHLIEEFPAEAAGEGQNAWCHRSCSFFISH